MAKKLIARPDQDEPVPSADEAPRESEVPEHGLVDDIVFDPPLPPDELRRRYGIGISWEERLAQAERQLAEDYDLVGDVVFDPPLTPEERRRRGVGLSVEERLEQIRRRRAEDAEQA